MTALLIPVGMSAIMLVRMIMIAVTAVMIIVSAILIMKM